MGLYTFILNFDSTISIAQAKANNELVAMRAWLKQLNVDSIKGFTKKQQERLIREDFEDEVPVLITGCVNVWCFGLRISNSKELALVTFIKTVN